MITDNRRTSNGITEKYCKENPDYQNNRTTHAVANISRVYDDRLIKHDFLREDEP